MTGVARRRLSSDDRREQIVDAARTLFAAQGYAATTTRHLARAAGVSDALLYRHFASKQEILERVVDRAIAAFSALPPLDRLRDRSTRELLTLLGHGFLTRVDANLDLITLLIGERTVIDPRFARFIDDAATGLGAELHRRSPRLPAEEGYLVARTFFGALMSFVLLARVLGMDGVHPIDPERYVDHLAARTADSIDRD